MSPLPLLLAIGQLASAPPPKPLVLAIDGEPGRLERTLMEAPTLEARKARLKGAGWTTREFDDFTLAFPVDLLGVAEAKRQIPMLKALAQAAKGGERVVRAKDLGPEEATLRGLVAANVPGPQRALAGAPDLRLKLTPLVTMTLSGGGRTIPVDVTYGDSPGMGKDASRMDPAPHPTEPPPEKGKDGAADALAPARKARQRLTFLLPYDLDGVRGMEWIAQSQDALLKEARAAKAEWTVARDALLATLDADLRSAFTDYPNDRNPRFSDLMPQKQRQTGEFYGRLYGGYLGNQDANSWFVGSSTTAFDVRPGLQLRVAQAGGDGKTFELTEIYKIPLDSPIGP